MCGGRFVVGALAPEERAEARTTNGSRGDLKDLGSVVVLGAVVQRVAIPRAPSPSSHICRVQARPGTQTSWRECRTAWISWSDKSWTRIVASLEKVPCFTCRPRALQPDRTG
jgi:hypothetical protein